MQLDSLGQPVTVLLCVGGVFDLPAVLLEAGQAAVGIQRQAAFAARCRESANPPGQIGHRQLPAHLFFEQGVRAWRGVATLVGDFQRDVAGATGQAGRATTQRAGEADIVVVLALQPEQGAAARVFRGANADLAVDLPAIEGCQLLFLHAPLRGVALTLEGFTGTKTRTAGEQGDEAENDDVAQKHDVKGSRIRSGA
ncbi:hypothetical protein D3C84_569910 [compost metagenome]